MPGLGLWLWLWLLPLLLIAAGCKQAPGGTPVAKAAIEAAMRDSAAGWNGGDLDHFMAVYADHPGTSFVTKDELIRGKSSIAARYAPSFARGENTRGTLDFEFLDFRMVGADHALLIARYRLTPTGGGEVVQGPTSCCSARPTPDGGSWRITAGEDYGFRLEKAIFEIPEVKAAESHSSAIPHLFLMPLIPTPARRRLQIPTGGKHMTGSSDQLATGTWNYWRIARWTAGLALLLTPLMMMQISDEWHWTIGSFLFAGAMIGGVGLLYEFAERLSCSRAYRAGAAVALVTSFLTVWTTIVRDDGTGIGFFLLVLTAVVGGFSAWFRPAGMARTMLGVAIMQALLGVAIATAPSTASIPGGPFKILLFSGFFMALWLSSAALFRVAAKEDHKAAAAC